MRPYERNALFYEFLHLEEVTGNENRDDITDLQFRRGGVLIAQVEILIVVEIFHKPLENVNIAVH